MKRFVAFVAVQAVLVIALTEIGARIIDPAGISYYPETARLFDAMVIEEPIGYRFPPGMSDTYYGVSVQTNSLGMRDREIPPSKAVDEFRILILGDSVVFGYGVEFEDSIPYQLEQILSEGASGRRWYRTLNMGVPSYNTEQELIQLQQTGLALEPDLVVLVFVRNDIEEKMWVFEKRSGWLSDFAQRSYALSLAFVIYRNALQAIGSGDRPGVTSGYAGYEVGNARWLAIDRSLTQIHRTLRGAGIPFLVVTDTPLEGAHADLLRSVAEREGFPIRDIDLYSDPRWAGQPRSSLRNSRIDGHCNREGCRAMATLLHERIVELALLDIPPLE